MKQCVPGPNPKECLGCTAKVEAINREAAKLAWEVRRRWWHVLHDKMHCIVQAALEGGAMGESGRGQPLTRFQEHRRATEKKNKAVGEHFAEQNCGTEELNFVPFMAIKEKSPYVRNYMEKLLIANSPGLQRASCATRNISHEEANRLLS